MKKCNQGFCEMCSEDVYDKCFPVKEKKMDQKFNLTELEQTIFEEFKHSCEWDNLEKYSFCFSVSSGGENIVIVKCLCGAESLLSCG